MAIEPGQIYCHNRFYKNNKTGEWQRKYLLVLAFSPGGDIVFRLLTSRVCGRSATPRCCKDAPYHSFYLGYIGGPLTTDSWLDLRQQDDYDNIEFLKNIDYGDIQFITSLNRDLLCSALECAANADDTSQQQARWMWDIRTKLSC